MIIENLDALKTWLSKTLEPICDADPSALAKYVVALVKKDKSEKELKALCIDQLDVFLQKETQIFVDKLFEAVNAKSYLPQPEQPTSASRTETHQRTEKNETKREEQPSRDEDREKKFSRRINHSPPSSSRYSRDSRRVDDHKKDDRSRKREYDRNPPRRESYRERYNRRRERSRSRSWSKDRTRDRDRERDRSRSRTRSRSRSRERDSGKPKYEHSRPEILINTIQVNRENQNSFEPEVYNPEAPSMTSRPIYRHRVNAQRPNLIGLTMGEVDLPPREKMLNSNSARIVLESDSRKRGAGMHDGTIPAKKPWFDKPNFNKPNHHSFHRRVPYSSANAKLAIRQIPPELNNISKLNEHFSKFGTIVNLQVAYNNDPEGALIQFASPEEAKRAMQSTEAVLNNRFIRVHWHREDAVEHTHTTPHPSIQTAQEPVVTTPKQSVKDRLGPLPSAHPEPSHDPGGAPQNTTKASVKERLGLSKPAGFGGKVFSTSTGLTKTVYNPAALKAGQKGALFGSAAVSAEDALKRKREAMRLQHDVRKKKQEILEKHIQTQKLLISKLEKNRSMKAEDKALIMQTLTTFTNSITKLQEEMKGLSSTNALKTTLKSKAQAQKELLDTELDLYKKMQAGEDTAELKIKYTQLQLEAAKRGLLTPGRGRGAHGRGRGGLRSRGRGRGVPTHAVVDHRPRALEIGGFTEADRVDLLPHFAQYGEIEDCQMEDSSLSAIITYKTRAEAERAAIHGVRLNNQELRLAWHKPTASLNTTDPDEVEPEDEEFPEDSFVDDSLLQDDDEEEDDNESRSWRR
ncbi:RNA-binding protein 26 [Sinocyclocheilus grahami]|uniref:RNA-binding protein 26 n=1 Tax=Sinocyclocheilus grahami TaxID=75366 RepID=UPI0007ACB146|nr:PREDICTED: RNA-binding protein 26-like [Sinocyclocheilus grahami]